MIKNHEPSALIYLVDDEFAVRDSLTLLIESTGQSIRSFDSADAFLANYNPALPGCLLLDVRMPIMDGLELQEELIRRSISVPIIFISGNADIPDSAKAFRAGAVDFLEKPFDSNVLLARIAEAVKKDIEYRRKQIEKRKLQERLNYLTEREKEVLCLIVSSYSNKEAAKALDISKRTIDIHRAHIMEKMQAENIAELIMMAMQCEVLGRNLH
ncbi:Response regulator protein TodT [Crenothrix polyspora]|uniref:Response regulator protein TodT n=1 Tax=Crenothrix polyspora TaxID=360316 RepID=A0A1R4H2K9_9GAMM|nr:response regulator [Crenothrix polyspora]SJM90468.1 Response regulator protein TodT [Crenothrix polyspora]